MKTKFIKFLIIYGIIFFIINYFNSPSITLLIILKIIVISILCGAVLSVITLLLKKNFVKDNRKKFKNMKSK